MYARRKWGVLDPCKPVPADIDCLPVLSNLCSYRMSRSFRLQVPHPDSGIFSSADQGISMCCKSPDAVRVPSVNMGAGQAIDIPFANCSVQSSGENTFAILVRYKSAN